MTPSVSMGHPQCHWLQRYLVQCSTVACGLRTSWPSPFFWQMLSLLLSFLCQRKEHDLEHLVILAVNQLYPKQKIRQTKASGFVSETFLGSTAKKKKERSRGRVNKEKGRKKAHKITRSRADAGKKVLFFTFGQKVHRSSITGKLYGHSSTN